MSCEHCTGSRWLLDDGRLGDCVCVTAEALREADGTLTAIAEDIEKLVDALHDYMRSIGAPVDAVRHENPHFDALVDAVAVCEGYVQ